MTVQQHKKSEQRETIQHKKSGFRFRDVRASLARQKPASDQMLDYASVDLHYPKSNYGARITTTTKKDWRGSVVTQWWQCGYWFDSASKCPQCFQKRELGILIATVCSTFQWGKKGKQKKKSPGENISNLK